MTTAGRSTPAGLARLVKRLTAQAGFDRAGIARAEPLGREDFLRAWLLAGFAGQMAYLARNTDRRNDPRLLLDGARSVICLAADYRDSGPDDLAPCPPGHGYIARCARGPDYHVRLRAMAHRLVEQLHAEIAQRFQARVCVDTAPLLERELAARAGLGWIGRNTCLIHPRAGSCCFLAEIVTTLDLAPDRPVADGCARCRRCLDACPTGALARPHVLDASRCISYLTIELPGRIPEDLRGKMGAHLFGCDICQAVCPHNRDNRRKGGDSPHEAGDALDSPGDPGLSACINLHRIAQWDAAEYSRNLPGAASRATLPMWRRNAAVALANNPDPAAAQTLGRLGQDPDPVVAEHARWGLARIGRKRKARA